MNRTRAAFYLIACLFVLPALVNAQQQNQTLTNADVMAMFKAGLPEHTIILAIQRGPSDFDTSAQTLIQLKNQGISPNILDAMLEAGKPVSRPAQLGDYPGLIEPFLFMTLPEMANGSEVILVDGNNRTQLKQSLVSSRTGGAAMQGIVPFRKTRIKGVIEGNRAQFRVTNTSPLFEVTLASYLDPYDYVKLVKLSPKSDRREVETARMGGMGGYSAGFRREDIIPVSIDELSKSSAGTLYRIKTMKPLAPGEYALTFVSTFYAFGVDPQRRIVSAN
jgi:hypothetical protein